MNADEVLFVLRDVLLDNASGAPQIRRSMKLSITPAGVNGYSLSTTSSPSTNVFGCTKIFLGYTADQFYSPQALDESHEHTCFFSSTRSLISPS